MQGHADPKTSFSKSGNDHSRNRVGSGCPTLRSDRVEDSKRSFLSTVEEDGGVRWQPVFTVSAES